MTDKPFWLIWSPDGVAPPKMRYPTKNAAESAAQSMAAKTGFEFYVLRAQCCYQQQLGMCRFPISGNWQTEQEAHLSAVIGHDTWHRIFRAVNKKDAA